MLLKGVMDLNRPIKIQGWGMNLFAVDQVTRMLARGEVTPDRKFFQEGMEGWLPLSELPGMMASSPPRQASGPVPPPKQNTARVPMPSPRGDPSASSFRRVSSIRLAKAREELKQPPKP